MTDLPASSAPPPPVGEDRAAPAKVLFAAAENVMGLVRAALDEASCQLAWADETYGRVFSLAALSHECVVLEQLASGVRQKYPSSIMALLARQHLETWLTGMYLFMGGDEALEVFLGDSHRSHEALRVEIEKLHRAGVALDVELPPLEDFEWDAALGNTNALRGSSTGWGTSPVFFTTLSPCTSSSIERSRVPTAPIRPTGYSIRTSRPGGCLRAFIRSPKPLRCGERSCRCNLC